MQNRGFALTGLSLLCQPLMRFLDPPYAYGAAAVFLAAGLAGIYVEHGRRSRLEKDVQRSGLHDLLLVILSQVRALQERRETKTLRINIMRVVAEKLVIVDQVGMDNAPDADIEFSLGQGCCGNCAGQRRLIVGDLERVYDATYEGTCSRNDGLSPWGISRAQWEKTRDLKSLISVPIFHPKDESRVIAVLNLDDKVPLATAGFLNDSVTRVLEGCTLTCAEYIMKVWEV